MKKKCKTCDLEFNVKPSHYEKRVNCSRRCLGKYNSEHFKGKKNPNYKNVKEKKCKICESLFFSYSKKRQFCSNKCVAVNNRSESFIALLDCEHCKKKFKPRGRKKYCSKQCQENDIKARNPCKNKDCNNKARKGCVYCESHKPIPRGKFNKRCKICKINFKSYIKVQKYCSKDCYQYTLTGKGNPNYKTGNKSLKNMIRDCKKSKQIKKIVLKRDKYKCKNCGQIGGRLEVDHINKFSIIFNEFLVKYIS